MDKLVAGTKYNKLASMYEELVSEVITLGNYSIWNTTTDYGAKKVTLFKRENNKWNSFIVTNEVDDFLINIVKNQ